MKLLKCILAFILSLLLTTGIAFGHEEEQLLVDTLKLVGAEPEMMDIVDWSVINREFMGFDEMEECRDKILDVFEVGEKSFDVIKENSEIYRILYTSIQIDSETFLQITLQSLRLPEEYEKAPQTYLVVNVSGKELGKFAEYGQKVREAMLLFEGESKITSCITGAFDGKLDEAKHEQILEKIFDYLKISDAQMLQDPYTLSLVGHSPLFGRGIEILDKTYNVNISVRYNSDDDKTYMWIGTPVISLEY